MTSEKIKLDSSFRWNDELNKDAGSRLAPE